MSGLEVAGIVLATLPLVISALEHYADGVRTIAGFRRFEKELKSVREDLATERILLRQSLQLLLGSIVNSKDELQRLIDDPGGALWSEDNFTERLKETLGESYQVYVDKMEDMNEAMNELKTRLQLDSSGKVPWSGPDGFQKYVKGMKFVRGMKFILLRTYYKEIIGKIQAGNRTMAQLTHNWNQLEISGLSHRHFDSSFFEKIRQTAVSILKGLKSTLACTCPERHTVNLELVHRRSKRLVHGEGAMSAMDLRFAAFLSYPGPSHTFDSYRSGILWKEIYVSIAQYASISTANAVHPNSIAMARNLSSIPIQPNLGSQTKKPKKRVNFTSKLSHWTSASTLQSTLTATQPSSDQTRIGLCDITNSPTNLIPPVSSATLSDISLAANTITPAAEVYLCREMQASSNTRPRRITTGGCWMEWKLDPIPNRAWRILGLYSVLRGEVSNVPEFSWADKLNTALTLASTILQLPESSWLSLDWMKKNVIFFQRKEQEPYKQLYFSKQFATKNLPLHREDTADHDEAMPFIRNRAIFTLGLLLIELCFAKPIEELRVDTDPLPTNGGPNDLTRYAIALRLLDDGKIRNEKGLRFEKAVRRCIVCNFDHGKPDLEDKKFQAAFYEEVVLLLEQDLAAFHDVEQWP